MFKSWVFKKMDDLFCFLMQTHIWWISCASTFYSKSNTYTNSLALYMNSKQNIRFPKAFYTHQLPTDMKHSRNIPESLEFHAAPMWSSIDYFWSELWTQSAVCSLFGNVKLMVNYFFYIRVDVCDPFLYFS